MVRHCISYDGHLFSGPHIHVLYIPLFHLLYSGISIERLITQRVLIYIISHMVLGFVVTLLSEQDSAAYVLVKTAS